LTVHNLLILFILVVDLFNRSPALVPCNYKRTSGHGSDVKCQGCAFNITTVFSHSQTMVVCGNCQTVLCQTTGGKARITEGCSFKRKERLSGCSKGKLW
ncbi:hypothetical protein MKW92_040370, partial [Papaver armeniacum]